MQENNNINVTLKEFLSMNLEEKYDLAKNTSITQEVQKLFFTQKYDDKHWVLQNLSKNTSITQEVQMMFFTQKYYEKSNALRHLAGNTGITPEVQKLFFTQKYGRKDWALWHLATNTSITLDVQMMFFTQKYESKYYDKSDTLRNLAGNTSFPHKDISLTFELTDKNWLQFVLDYGHIRGTLKLVPPRIKKLPEYKATRILSMIAVNR